MSKKVKIKTTKTSLSVSAYLNAIEPAAARKDAKQLAKLFKQITATRPKMWGTSMIGYGEYTYYRANGDKGEMLATGFAHRQSGPVLYVISGYKDVQDLLEILGPHKLGKSCLYLKNLDEVNLEVLGEIIQRGLASLKITHAVRM